MARRPRVASANGPAQPDAIEGIKLSWGANDVRALMRLTALDIVVVMTYLAGHDVDADARERLEQADRKRGKKRAPKR